MLPSRCNSDVITALNPTVVLPGHVPLLGAEQLHAEVHRLPFVGRQRQVSRDEVGCGDGALVTH